VTLCGCARHAAHRLQSVCRDARPMLVYAAMVKSRAQLEIDTMHKVYV